MKVMPTQAIKCGTQGLVDTEDNAILRRQGSVFCTNLDGCYQPTVALTGIILCMQPANERRRYIVTYVWLSVNISVKFVPNSTIDKIF